MHKLNNKNRIPSFDKMLKPVLIAIKELGGKANIDEIDNKVIEIMKLSDDVCSIPHGLTTNSEISYRCAWARTYLKKYGLIDNINRGVWEFTDKYNEKIEDIDIELIKQKVRQQTINNFNNSELSNLEAYVAFEKYATSVLEEYASHQNKTMLIENTSEINFDAILPDGIDDITKKTYVIFKYSRTNKRFDFRAIESECLRLSSLANDSHILLILGTILLENFKEHLEKRISAMTKNSITIWDYNDLIAKSNLESEYTEYLINPKKALVIDAISLRQNEKEREKNKDNLIEKLKIAYKREDVVLFLGAGVSIEAGIPLWSELIKKLLIQMINNKSKDSKLTKDQIEILNKLAYSNKEDSPLTQVRYIRTAFEQPDYYELVHKVLYESKKKLNTKLLNSIVDICTPRRHHMGVQSVITYNFDDVFESGLKKKKIEYNVVYREADISDYDCLNIYHVHGYLPTQLGEIINNDMNLIFSEEDYHKVYRDAYCWSNITQLNAFRDNTCFFIGCSLTDPNLRRLLDVAARQGEMPRHFAIMKKNNIKVGSDNIEQNLIDIYEKIDMNIRESYFRSIGLNIIWINDFEEIPDIINELKK